MIVLYYFLFTFSLVCTAVVSIDSTSKMSHDCFLSFLHKTQNCSNPNVFYVTAPMGECSGLGSEFNRFLIYSLLTAVSNNRRIVYLHSNRRWEYHCNEKWGWGCYLSFACHESGVNQTELDFSPKGIHEDPINTGSGFLDMLQLLEPKNIQQIRESIIDMNKTYSERNKHIFSASCAHGIGPLNPTIVTSMAAKYLYHLNNRTKIIVQELIHQNNFMDLESFPYISLQLRMNDKQYEMPPKTWYYINNVSNIVAEISPYFKKLNISRLFLATDNCTAAQEIFRLLIKSNVITYSSCLTRTGEIALLQPLRGGVELKDNSSFPLAPYRVFMDIKLLRKGRLFFGLFDSNLVRLVHRLRWPNYQMSRALATSTYSDERAELNTHMDDIPLRLFGGE
mmetsp:Transcript_19904/g.28509  ORF Transcript_19904/g.28509 Transcript_19904/m.28509 type:complete len:394 (+) Transcript_19904:1226-2407(+)